MKRITGNGASVLLRGAVCAACILLLAGCVSGPRELPLEALAESGTFSGAEPGLPLVKVRLGTGTLLAEIARTPLQTATGLSFRTSLARDSGMLFVYPAPFRASFYMKNTSIPLSGAYIDSRGTILEIHDLTPDDETPVVSRTENVQFVLEVNLGWFGKNGVTVGSRMTVER